MRRGNSNQSTLIRKGLLAGILLTVSLACGNNKGVPGTDANQKSTMRKIYEEDQRNRNDTEGDARRRAEVTSLMAEGKIQTAEDYYYAAFTFQHGQKPSDYLYAHVLAVTAVSKGLHNAAWLSAATLDRYLHSMRRCLALSLEACMTRGTTRNRMTRRCFRTKLEQCGASLRRRRR
jgi:hypothetical protein